MKPLIGLAGFVKEVTAARDVREPAVLVYSRYVESVRAAGGTPVVLPYGVHDVARFDGFVLIGGGDVDPGRYGAHAHPEVAGVDPDRDASEIALALAAMEHGLPLLAICRGAQVLNVALGGTLVQHVEGHHVAPGKGLPHEVRAEPGSRIADACGTAFVAWSSHHQVIDRLGRGLRATAWAPDGVLEGAETEAGWVVAAQWHPERTADTDPAQLALFRALVAAAGRSLPLGP